MQSSVAIVLDEHNRVLCVSRKNDHTKYGLIGGKIEEYETPKQALMREVLEETNLEVLDCKYLCTRVVEESNCECFCFIVPMYSWFGTPKNTEGCYLKWMTFPELISCSAFPEYNKSVFAKLKGAVK